MKCVFVWGIRDFIRSHKTMFFLLLLLYLLYYIIMQNSVLRKTDIDCIIDEWSKECIGMSIESLDNYLITKEKSISNMKLTTVDDYARKKKYDIAYKTLCIQLNERKKEEIIKMFCDDQSGFIDKKFVINMSNNGWDTYGTLPISDIYNTKYLDNYLRVQNYNFLFIIGIILGCGIWGGYYEYRINNLEMIALNGKKIFKTRHYFGIVVLLLYALLVILSEIKISRIDLLLENTNYYIRLYFSNYLIWMNVRDLVIIQSVYKILNLLIWYLATIILCQLIKKLVPSMIILGTATLGLYLINNILFKIIKTIFLPVGYYRIEQYLAVFIEGNKLTVFETGVVPLGIIILTELIALKLLKSN